MKNSKSNTIKGFGKGINTLSQPTHIFSQTFKLATGMSMVSGARIGWGQAVIDDSPGWGESELYKKLKETYDT